MPLALAENSGLNPIETLAGVKSRQTTEKNSRLGVDCIGAGENGACRQAENVLTRADMKVQHVCDPLISKRSQYLLATQLVRQVLKVRLLRSVSDRPYIDDVIQTHDQDAEY